MVVQVRQRIKPIADGGGDYLIAVDGERVWFKRRELEALRLLCQHQCTNQELAEYMGITRQTAKNYVSDVLEKMAARNRAEAIIHLIRTKQMY